MAGSGARGGARSMVTSAGPGVVRRGRSPERTEAERSVVAELEAWRATSVPDRLASFDAETLAHLVRACYAALGVDDEVGRGFTVNTVHYYRRKDILDEPAGRTSAARYDVRHLWQAVGARLAGHLGLVTLAEAREAIRGADESTLLAFVAARVVDARSRQQLRRSTSVVAAPVQPSPHRHVRALNATTRGARPLPGVLAAPAPNPDDETPTPSVVIPLPGDAWCIVPASHPAHRSPSAARDVVTALAAALRVTLR